jgi:transketolase
VIDNHSSSLQLDDLAAKFAAFGWASTTIDGRDHAQIEAALSHPDASRPTAVIAEIAS